MPKATLTFDLPEEQEEYRQAIDGWKWELVVSALAERLRRAIKYEEREDEETLEEIREWLFDELADRDLSL